MVFSKNYKGGGCVKVVKKYLEIAPYLSKSGYFDNKDIRNSIEENLKYIKTEIVKFVFKFSDNKATNFIKDHIQNDKISIIYKDSVFEIVIYNIGIIGTFGIIIKPHSEKEKRKSLYEKIETKIVSELEEKGFKEI